MENENASPAVRVGIDYALKLSFAAIDRADCNNKRDLLYSLVCFGCMFDTVYATEPDPIVRKYDCLTEPEPNKLDLYELTLTVLTLKGISDETASELRKSWYMTFAYMIIGEAPHSPELYLKIRSVTHTEENFAAVLASRYSVFIPATVEELRAQGASELLVDWYAPYLDYCQVRDGKGVTRETAECKRLLALGQFDESLLRSERLLASFPDDFEIAVTDIAARVSLSGATDKQSRESLLRDTLSLIDDYIDVAPGQYFRYYRGLTLLGLMDIKGAREEFEACLARDPSFELAAFMLKGMDKYTT